MDLWNFQTITMEPGLRKSSLETLEQRLADTSLANSVSTFRDVLTGHERDLVDRFLFVMTVAEPVVCADQARIEAAVQGLACQQRLRGTKRKHGMSLEAATQNCNHDGVSSDLLRPAKRTRAERPDLEELIVMVGLAGIPVDKILSCGVSLYCEAQRRPNMVAERYTTKYILERVPHGTPRRLLHFFQHLLGDAVFSLLCADLRTQVAARNITSAAAQPVADADVQTLIAAFQAVVERHARNFTAFERRQRVRQLSDAAMQAASGMLAQTFYNHLEPNEIEAWGCSLHALGREDLWRPL